MVQGRTIWVSLEPLPEGVEELVRWFLEAVELPEDEIRVDTKGWAASVVVARSLGRRVAVKSVIRKFW